MRGGYRRACVCCAAGGGGVGTRPWWLTLLACGGAYWPLGAAGGGGGEGAPGLTCGRCLGPASVMVGAVLRVPFGWCAAARGLCVPGAAGPGGGAGEPCTEATGGVRGSGDLRVPPAHD